MTRYLPIKKSEHLRPKEAKDPQKRAKYHRDSYSSPVSHISTNPTAQILDAWERCFLGVLIIFKIALKHILFGVV
jgi:hypothetical protein